MVEPTKVGLCHLTPGSMPVLDADEEVFLLYTELAGKTSSSPCGSPTFRGLGHVDSHKDVLTVTFELKSRDPVPLSVPRQRHHERKKKGEKKPKKGPPEETIEVHLAQDKTALRSRKGDTGSVLWLASVEFAQIILQQHHDTRPDSFLDYFALAMSHVLELGAGTGLLSIVLSPLVGHYTVTDIEALMPLIRKNLSMNIPGWDGSSPPEPCGTNMRRNITADPLDWMLLQNCSTVSRTQRYSYKPVDLLLVVDCVYHPSILPSLIFAIDYLATPDRTIVVVVVELRAEDVVREFLELWMKAGEGAWRIWHVNDIMKGPYAVWIGRKRGDAREE